MGGGYALLSSTSEGALEDFYANDEEIWKPFFTFMVPWYVSLNISKRSVWVLCRGIPLHAWKDSVFFGYLPIFW